MLIRCIAILLLCLLGPGTAAAANLTFQVDVNSPNGPNSGSGSFDFTNTSASGDLSVSGQSTLVNAPPRELLWIKEIWLALQYWRLVGPIGPVPPGPFDSVQAQLIVDFGAAGVGVVNADYTPAQDFAYLQLDFANLLVNNLPTTNGPFEMRVIETVGDGQGDVSTGQGTLLIDGEPLATFTSSYNASPGFGFHPRTHLDLAVLATPNGTDISFDGHGRILEDENIQTFVTIKGLGPDIVGNGNVWSDPTPTPMFPWPTSFEPNPQPNRIGMGGDTFYTPNPEPSGPFPAVIDAWIIEIMQRLRCRLIIPCGGPIPWADVIFDADFGQAGTVQMLAQLTPQQNFAQVTVDLANFDQNQLPLAQGSEVLMTERFTGNGPGTGSGLGKLVLRGNGAKAADVELVGNFTAQYSWDQQYDLDGSGGGVSVRTFANLATNQQGQAQTSGTTDTTSDDDVSFHLQSATNNGDLTGGGIFAGDPSPQPSKFTIRGQSTLEEQIPEEALAWIVDLWMVQNWWRLLYPPGVPVPTPGDPAFASLVADLGNAGTMTADVTLDPIRGFGEMRVDMGRATSAGLPMLGDEYVMQISETITGSTGTGMFMADGIPFGNIQTTYVDGLSKRRAGTALVLDTQAQVKMQPNACVMDFVGDIEQNTTTDVATDLQPTSVVLRAPRPNPMTSATTLSFSLVRPGSVELVMYDARGRRVRTLLQGEYPAGSHSASWDGRTDRGDAVASGVYWARLNAGGNTQTRRMTVVR